MQMQLVQAKMKNDVIRLMDIVEHIAAKVRACERAIERARERETDRERQTERDRQRQRQTRDEREGRIEAKPDGADAINLDQSVLDRDLASPELVVEVVLGVGPLLVDRLDNLRRAIPSPAQS